MEAEIFLLVAIALGLIVAFVVGIFAGIALGRVQCERSVLQRELAHARHDAQERVKAAITRHVRAGVNTHP